MTMILEPRVLRDNARGVQLPAESSRVTGDAGHVDMLAPSPPTPYHYATSVISRAILAIRGLRTGTAHACLAGALALAACGGGDAVVIGLAGPFTEPRGVSMKRSAEMAVDEINRSGALGSRRLELLVMDDSAQSGRAIAVAESLRRDPRVLAVIGHLTSAPTIAAAAIYNSGSDPVMEISPSASSPDLSGIGPYTFRVCATDLAHGTALAQHAYDRLGVRAVAIIYQNDDYGRGIVATFRAEFTRRGGIITGQDPVLGAETDPSPYLDRIQRDGRAAALMVAADRLTATRVLRLMRQRGLTLPVLGGDALTGIQAEGALAEGVYLTSNYLPERPGARNTAFVRAYAAAFGGDRPDHRGAGAYDAVHLIADAVRAGAASRRAVRDYLAAVGQANGPAAYDGVTGRIAFDELGDVRNKSVVVGVVRGGRIVLADAP
jgi:branched-chain amino acid transport system substrate-binding protein